jgi:type IV pilus assembly protein PilM
MDRMSQNDAREVIRWEAEQHVPFDMENVQLDFQILDPDEDTPQMAVLLVAAKRELIENRLSLLADAGLEPGIIDVEAFALHNAFERNYPDVRDGMVALVNIGHETTNVNLLSAALPVLVRDVPFGTRRLRESLQRERSLTATGRGRAAGPHRPGCAARAARGARRRAGRRHRARRRVHRRAVRRRGRPPRLPVRRRRLRQRHGRRRGRRMGVPPRSPIRCSGSPSGRKSCSPYPWSSWHPC